MVRIAHISDSHLGASMFQLTERREDVRKCLKKAIEMALRHSPDLLVHTGDLFDSPFPSIEDMDFALSVFKEHIDIPTIVIQGNHDIPYGYHYNQSPIRVLETTELVISTGNSGERKQTFEFDGKKVEVHMLSWMRGNKLQRLLNDYSPECDIAVLFSHDVGKKKDRLPVHYDYIGYGHSHRYQLDEENAIGCPGSTCMVDWRKEIGGKSKLIVVDIDSSGIEFETEILNDVREFKFLPTLDVTGMGPKEIDETLKARLGTLSVRKKGKPIVILRVTGIVHSDTESLINRTEAIEYGEEKLDPLFLHIEPNLVNVGPRSVSFSSPLDVTASVEEFMNQTNHVETDAILSELKVILGG